MPKGGALETEPKLSPGRLMWTTDLRYLIGYAYGLQPNRISGTISGSEHTYRIEAVTRPEATGEEVRAMLQALLADRFKMTAHRETKQAERYFLSVAKGGLKMREEKTDGMKQREDQGDGPPEGRAVATLVEPGIGKITARNAPMPAIAECLEWLVGGVVIDGTGLAGRYTFSLRYLNDERGAKTDASTLPVALRRELGLRIDKQKGPVEMLVVDHIEDRPAAN